MYNTVQYTVQYNYIIPDSGGIWQVALVGLNIVHFIFLYVYYKTFKIFLTMALNYMYSSISPN
jgi:hypothetical protein